MCNRNNAVEVFIILFLNRPIELDGMHSFVQCNACARSGVFFVQLQTHPVHEFSCTGPLVLNHYLKEIHTHF